MKLIMRRIAGDACERGAQQIIKFWHNVALDMHLLDYSRTDDDGNEVNFSMSAPEIRANKHHFFYITAECVNEVCCTLVVISLCNPHKFYQTSMDGSI